MALMQVDFFSMSLKRTVSVKIVLPTDKFILAKQKAHSGTYPTLYLLHGVFGNDTDWITGTRVQALAEAHDLCVVMPCGDNKFYCDSAVTGDLYGTLIGSELVDFTRRTFPLSSRRQDTFIGGLSMGGFGAIVNGLRQPETFGCIAGFSSGLIKDSILHSGDQPNPFFTRQNYQAMFGLQQISDYAGSDNDYEALARQAAGHAVRPKIYLCCGRQDPLYRANAAYAELLQQLNYDVTWQAWDGIHDWKFWGEAIEKVMDWLPLGAENAGVSSGNLPD